MGNCEVASVAIADDRQIGEGWGADVRCRAGTGGAGYSRVHRGDEPRGIARGLGDLPVPDWCGLNPGVSG